ncbi:MAG: TetR/AcrR family transcriptional regulator [Polyangiaceae bacterium]|jgi:AcrR family transcriptional regulator
MGTLSEQQQPKARKDEILDVATHLFAERGYEGTSMNDVAERVGMRKASLFYHFATKDSLYESVLERLIQRLATALSAAYDGSGSFGERLEAAADVLATVLAQRPFAARLLMREAIDWGPTVRGGAVGPLMRALEASAAFIRAGQDAGEFIAGDAKQIVLTTFGVHFLPFAIGQVVERYVGTSPFDPGFVAARCAEIRKNVRQILVHEAAG